MRGRRVNLELYRERTGAPDFPLSEPLDCFVRSITPLLDSWDVLTLGIDIVAHLGMALGFVESDSASFFDGTYVRWLSTVEVNSRDVCTTSVKCGR